MVNIKQADSSSGLEKFPKKQILQADAQLQLPAEVPPFS